MSDKESQKKQAVEKKEQETDNKQKQAPAKTSASIPVSYLSFLALLGIAGFSFVLWNKIQDLRIDQQQILVKAQKEIRKLEQSVIKKQQEFTAFKQVNSTQLKDLNDALVKLRSIAGREKTGWVLSEVEYLLLIANHQIRLRGDIKTAVQALTEADQRLHSLGDPRTLPVRKSIAVEIEKLRNVSVPDISGMILKLDSLSGPVSSMILVSASPGKLREQAKLPNKSNTVPTIKAKGWRSSLDNAWSELKTLVVVRRRNKRIEPMLSLEQELAIRQVLELKLQTARVALLRHQQARFKSALLAANSWIKQNFDTKSKTVKHVQAILDTLSKTPLKTVLPDISGSLQEVRNLLKQIGKA